MLQGRSQGSAVVRTPQGGYLQCVVTMLTAMNIMSFGRTRAYMTVRKSIPLRNGINTDQNQ